jgi:queuine tRNA-ribosyltransferase
MRIVSFENDLDPLRLAFRHNREFTYLRHSGTAGILEQGEWQSSQHVGLSWSLVQGDFLARMADAPAAPDLIFFDMFSSKTSADQWTLAAFRQVFRACHGRAVELFTYTCSTPIRAALLVAGFHIARGRSTGDKVETTIALTPLARATSAPGRHEFLAQEWLGKWGRSSAKFPADVSADEQPEFESAIRAHPQFHAP